MLQAGGALTRELGRPSPVPLNVGEGVEGQLYYNPEESQECPLVPWHIVPAAGLAPGPLRQLLNVGHKISQREKSKEEPQNGLFLVIQPLLEAGLLGPMACLLPFTNRDSALLPLQVYSPLTRGAGLQSLLCFLSLRVRLTVLLCTLLLCHISSFRAASLSP